MTPSRRSPVTQQKTEVPVSAVSDPPLEQPVHASSRESPISQRKSEVSESLKLEPLSAEILQTERDIVAPVGDTVVEERQTITMKSSPVVQDGRSLKDHVVLIYGYSPMHLLTTLKPIYAGSLKQKQSSASFVGLYQKQQENI